MQTLEKMKSHLGTTTMIILVLILVFILIKVVMVIIRLCLHLAGTRDDEEEDLRMFLTAEQIRRRHRNSPRNYVSPRRGVEVDTTSGLDGINSVDDLDPEILTSIARHANRQQSNRGTSNTVLSCGKKPQQAFQGTGFSLDGSKWRNGEKIAPEGSVCATSIVTTQQSQTGTNFFAKISKRQEDEEMRVGMGNGALKTDNYGTMSTTSAASNSASASSDTVSLSVESVTIESFMQEAVSHENSEDDHIKNARDTAKNTKKNSICKNKRTL